MRFCLFNCLFLEGVYGIRIFKLWEIVRLEIWMCWKIDLCKYLFLKED